MLAGVSTSYPSLAGASTPSLSVLSASLWNSDELIWRFSALTFQHSLITNLRYEIQTIMFQEPAELQGALKFYLEQDYMCKLYLTFPKSETLSH